MILSCQGGIYRLGPWIQDWFYLITWWLPQKYFGWEGFLCSGKPLDFGQPSPLDKQCQVSCQDDGYYLSQEYFTFVRFFINVYGSPKYKTFIHAKCKNRPTKQKNTSPHLLQYFPRASWLPEVTLMTSGPRKIS